MSDEKKYSEENTIKESVEHLIEHRIPWLFFGLLGGLLATVIVSRYEQILSADVRLAFFIPVMVYLSDAIGTQTETIYVRALAKQQVKFFKYILKESLVGVCLGVIFGLILGIFAAVWLKSPEIGLTIGVAMFINLSIAPVLAVVIPNLFYRKHADPALGSGPVATVTQDLFSLLVYFFVASLVVF